MNKVTFIIVTYNGEQYIENCINSIYHFDKEARIIIVDNNSTDNTKKIINELNVFKKIFLEENLGFGKSNNIGLLEALKIEQDAIFLINQDVYLESGDFDDFISTSIKSFKNNNYGIISPIHLQINKIDYDFKFINYISEKNTPELLSDIKNNKVNNKVYQSKSINAAAWLVSIECLNKVGLFDPIFPHYGEDSDYINRLKYHNLKIGVLPIFNIIHDRKQFENINSEKQIYSLKIWSLVYFKNININYFYLTLKYPIDLYFRVKNLKNVNILNKVLVFFKTYFLIFINIFLLIKQRINSKNKFSFFSQ